MRDENARNAQPNRIGHRRKSDRGRIVYALGFAAVGRQTTTSGRLKLRPQCGHLDNQSPFEFREIFLHKGDIRPAAGIAGLAWRFGYGEAHNPHKSQKPKAKSVKVASSGLVWPQKLLGLSITPKT